MADFQHVTHEEINELYHFRVLKKILMRTYPWIKDVTLPEEINKYSLIFLDITVDPWELAKQEDLTVKFYIAMRGFDWSPYLSTFFIESNHIRNMVGDIEKVIEKVQKSPAIPQDMKLPKSRKFQLGTWKLSPNATPLPEYTEVPEYMKKKKDIDSTEN